MFVEHDNVDDTDWHSFQVVAAHFKEISDEYALLALAKLNENKFDEALKIMDKAVDADRVLTVIKEYLSLQYKQVVSLH